MIDDEPSKHCPSCFLPFSPSCLQNNIMSKRTTFTTISPLPAGISREAVLGFLHNHIEMIDLNPLIKERHLIKPPSHAPPEEHSCVWYSLTDEISYLPGGLATGNISYTCAFYDLPNGLQTHCYAPMGLDIRDKWTIAGSLPGEPVEPVELGIGAPLTGLYIREDVDMRCNVFTTSFVKKTLKKSHGKLVDHLKTKVQQASAAAAQRQTDHTTFNPYQQRQAVHGRHSSQNSLPGSFSTASISSITPNSPSPQAHHVPSHASVGNPLSLPHRPLYRRPSPELADGGPQNGYPGPLRIRHASNGAPHTQTPSWSDARSQPGLHNNYTHTSTSQFAKDEYDGKTSQSRSPSPAVSRLPCSDANQQVGRQQVGGGVLNGPVVAELE